MVSGQDRIVFRLPEDRGNLLKRLKPRSILYDRSLLNDVAGIFEDVSRRGDSAVRSATKTFDKSILPEIVLSSDYVEGCVSSISSSLRKAIETAGSNIEQVNKALMPEPFWEKEIRQGTVIGEKVTPLESVGLWIPAMKGPLISTALMLVCAAKVAGVENITIGMPPSKNGLGDPGTVAAAKLAGASGFVVGNGAAVIAGFSIGTESIPEVEGIFGPGPGAIAAAMSIAFSYGKKTVMGIGPTDSVIIADDTADPEKVTYDLINEAEHGTDSSSILITTSSELAEEVDKLLYEAIEKVEENRKRVLRKVFGVNGMGAIIVSPDIESACNFVNDYAPEHLMVVCEEKRQKEVISKIKNAGEILIGEYTPFSAGNYAIGITAVLPTSGFSKVVSGVTCRDMIKYSTIGNLTKEALQEIYPTIRDLGEYEGFPCHIKAAEIRVAGSNEVA